MVDTTRINKGEMPMKVKLYTCQAGLNLWKRGNAFGAWERNSKAFEEGVTEGDNILIEVDTYDIQGNDQDNEYDIVAGADIRIIEGVVE
jgi:hypothetical protein